MYTTHPYVNSPPDNAVLWRYMDFTKFVSLLNKKALFLARPDKLGDPFEASLTHADLQSLKARYGDSESMKFTDMLKAMATHAAVSSWHESEFESEAMWRLYSREKDGIAIKTYGNSFKECMQDERNIYIGQVKYIDYQTDLLFDDGSFINLLFYKRLSFNHEQEVRALYFHPPAGTCRYDMADFPEGFDVGIYYKVDLSLLIQEVVVAPYAEDWFLELVKSVSARYGLETLVSKSNLAALPAGI